MQQNTFFFFCINLFCSVEGNSLKIKICNFLKNNRGTTSNFIHDFILDNFSIYIVFLSPTWKTLKGLSTFLGQYVIWKGYMKHLIKTLNMFHHFLRINGIFFKYLFCLNIKELYFLLPVFVFSTYKFCHFLQSWFL